jgi:hypothetical protein
MFAGALSDRPRGMYLAYIKAIVSGFLRAHASSAHRAPLRYVASPCSEEPDAGIPHVRICGSPGAAGATWRSRVARFGPAVLKMGLF